MDHEPCALPTELHAPHNVLLFPHSHLLHRQGREQLQTDAPRAGPKERWTGSRPEGQGTTHASAQNLRTTAAGPGTECGKLHGGQWEQERPGERTRRREIRVGERAGVVTERASGCEELGAWRTAGQTESRVGADKSSRGPTGCGVAAARRPHGERAPGGPGGDDGGRRAAFRASLGGERRPQTEGGRGAERHPSGHWRSESEDLEAGDGSESDAEGSQGKAEDVWISCRDVDEEIKRGYGS